MKSKDKALVVFQGKDIRRIWYKEEWWFSVVDVVAVLTDQNDYQTSRKYWNKLSQRLRDEGSEVVTNCHQLKLLAEDGKLRETDCANTKTMFRIIQSIPSKKAEPFKQWLAKVGYERVQEIENPELAQDRVKKYYELKGYPKDWIDKRLRGIAIRQELTDEWKQRNVGGGKEFSILTNEISKATFDKTIKQYKDFKGLVTKNQNLRDNMTDWELILTMVGEKSTTDITDAKDSQGFNECKDSAVEGGTIAKHTREEIEEKTGKKIVSKENYVGLTGKKMIKDEVNPQQ
ncbi:MAG: Bro-N domain-containing protein [Candidatus Woesearchaeota archaeon]|jgi:NAD-dependent DNA ligase|nr:Bro-N domain-containing protein [Candidatus Woesearchaeota archaeon]MDP7323473.1 Bro-N domain-containing protein [Candidatus Woesearchaeota archaeon]